MRRYGMVSMSYAISQEVSMNKNSTLDKVLTHTDNGRDIFKRFIPEWDGVSNRKILSPFTGKKSISIKCLPSGRWIYNDWVSGDKGDAITYVGTLYNCSFKDALDIICKDMIPNFDHNRVVPTTTEYVAADIHYQWCIPLEEDISYWEDGYGIDKEFLAYYEVHNVSKFRKITVTNGINEYGNWVYGSKDNPIYLYKYPHVDLNGEVLDTNTHRVAFYTPLNPNKTFKFQGNKGKGDIFGLNQCIQSVPMNTEPLYIFGGQKDVLNAVWNFNVSAIALLSETTTYIPPMVLEWIKYKYTEVIVIYDNDSVGIESAETLCDLYGFTNHTIRFHQQCPKEGYQPKDISDYIMAGIPIEL
jgi:hypothetical protein